MTSDKSLQFSIRTSESHKERFDYLNSDIATQFRESVFLFVHRTKRQRSMM